MQKSSETPKTEYYNSVDNLEKINGKIVRLKIRLKELEKEREIFERNFFGNESLKETYKNFYKNNELDITNITEYIKRKIEVTGCKNVNIPFAKVIELLKTKTYSDNQLHIAVKKAGYKFEKSLTEILFYGWVD